MTKWTEQDLLKLDANYAKEGIPFHARPFRAAVDLLGSEFSIGVGGNPEVQEITRTYQNLIPEAVTTWPGMGSGIVSSNDQVRKITVAVPFGTCRITPDKAIKAMEFDSPESWRKWCRYDPEIEKLSFCAVADIYDLAYGLGRIQQTTATEMNYWKLALSNLGDVANILSSSYSTDSVLQPICVMAELSMKATLRHCGLDEKTLKDIGHNHIKLAERMASEKPHKDDELIACIVNKLPNYVDSRYNPAGLTKLDVVRLAVGSQFIAASSVRRLSGQNISDTVDCGSRSNLRKKFFIADIAG